MEKIISELIKEVEIVNWQVAYNQTRISADFDVIVTDDLYKLLQLKNNLFPYEYSDRKFMGHNLIVTTTLRGYNFWIADRQEIKNENSD